MTKNQRHCVRAGAPHPYEMNLECSESVDVDGSGVLGVFFVDLGFPMAPVEFPGFPVDK